MAMESLVAELAAAFHERNPTVSLEVAGLGTHYGLEALQTGEADVALASWLPPTEASLVWAVAWIAIWTGLMWILYRLRIFIRI